MISCKLCGKNFETLEGIGKHLRFCEKNLEKIKAEDYYNLYIKKESDGKCIICGKDTRFNTLDLGFSTYCGASCSKFGVNKGLIAKPRIKKPDKNPVTCRLCNIEQNNLNSLRNHLRFCKSNHDKINSEQYYEKYMKKDDEGFCIVCGNITKFKGLDRGYDKYCSKSCSRQDNIIDSKIDNTPMFIDRLLKIGLEPIYEGDYFTGTQKIKFRCLTCNRVFENYTFNMLKIINKCPFCADRSRSVSEKLLYSYLKRKFFKFNVYNNYKNLFP